jgi:hypothetical protein
MVCFLLKIHRLFLIRDASKKKSVKFKIFYIIFSGGTDNKTIPIEQFLGKLLGKKILVSVLCLLENRIFSKKR